MINPSTLNPLTLPSLPLEQRSPLPQTPCIYFVIDHDGQVLCIGRSSVSPKVRWALDHKYVKPYLELPEAAPKSLFGEKFFIT
ncbi:MAG: hypothetical protein RM021_018460 [Nostoc sp. EkiNYC01]|nr:hypothetical protein [Nostoc sp. EkiNYC01]